MGDIVKEGTVILDRLDTGYRTRRGAVTVTCGICATLEPGMLTCLIGPNGAGKSTLLKTLAGFVPPLSGNVTVAGRPLGEYSASLFARTVAVVLTERPAVDNMTVSQLVALGRSPYTGILGQLSSDDRLAVRKALDDTGIAALAARRVNSLSDGERQKTMIAKALAQDTPVIILDEPTAFLDYPGKVEVLQLLHRLAHAHGKTVFMSTHDLDLALRIADSLWLLDKEQGLTVGTPRALGRDGTLGRYFDRPWLRYDPLSGTFVIP